jgi:hypothetical protein
VSAPVLTTVPVANSKSANDLVVDSSRDNKSVSGGRRPVVYGRVPT